MIDWLLYLIEASVAMTVFYAVYALLLRKLTFFDLNRYFLLLAVAVAVLIPVIEFDFSVIQPHASQRPVEVMAEFRTDYYEAVDGWVYEVQRGEQGSSEVLSDSTWSSEVKWILIWSVFGLYGAGLVFVLSRLVWTYRWMHQLKKRHPKQKMDGVWVVKVPYDMPPFSFLNATFVSAKTIEEESFDQVLAHEKQHIKQRHSIDLLFVQLLAAVFWFNPIIWQLKKSLKETHEFIVDKHMLREGYSLVAYQTLLLRQLISNNSYGLVHNFNLSFIKKRITMMKIQTSGTSGIMKAITAAAMVSVFSLLIVQCNMMLEEQAQAAPIPMQLPILSHTGDYQFTYDVKSSLTLRIDRDQLTVEGQQVSLKELPNVIADAQLDERATMIIQATPDQKMAFLRDVHDILRKENLRKLLYEAVDTQQKKVQIAILLPPDPASELGMKMPKITEAFIEENGYEVLWFQSRQQLGVGFQQRTYEFVKKQVEKGSRDYVISIKYDDEDTFQSYLESFFYTSRAFDLIYDERAQALFERSYYELDRDTEEGENQYRAVREGIPRAISIAE